VDRPRGHETFRLQQLLGRPRVPLIQPQMRRAAPPLVEFLRCGSPSRYAAVIRIFLSVSLPIVVTPLD